MPLGTAASERVKWSSGHRAKASLGGPACTGAVPDHARGGPPRQRPWHHSRMRRVMWLVPCWMAMAACTSATPPPEATAAAKEAAPVPPPEPVVAAICEPGATRPCYPGPPDTAGVGVCKAGTETCGGAAWGACKDALAPATEEDCRTPYDEDCDGRSDDCPEVEVALAIAFTRDRGLWIEDWGGGLGVVGGPIFWVVEPGGKVVDPWEEAEPDQDPTWERQPESSEAQTAATGGAWPGALLRTYETGGTRAGYVMEQERWDGSQFAGEENSDEYLQWRYEGAVPWRDGHAIAVRRTYQSYETMEQLDASTLEYGSITAAEQRALERKVDRVLGKAKPQLVIVAAGDAGEMAPTFGVFGAIEGEEGEGEGGEPGGEPEKLEPVVEVVEGEADAGPTLPQPPELPGELLSFVVLSDGTIAILGGQSRMWSWKPGQGRWKVIEPPPGFALEGRDVSLHAGPAGELLLRDCDGKRATGTLRRRSGSAWVDVGLPTDACPTSITSSSDGTRWMIGGDQVWQRRVGDAEPWKRVLLPTPWKARQVVAFDERVWIAAEAEGGKWAVLVDRAVPAVRVLPAQ